jgi:hypothetical protein
MRSGEINWAEYDEFLGKFTDREVAEMIGCSHQSVILRRNKLNIKMRIDFHGKIDWSIIKNRIGKYADGDVAKWYHQKTGRRISQSSITEYRRFHKIPDFVTTSAMSAEVRPWDRTELEIVESMKTATRRVLVQYYNKTIHKTFSVDVPDLEKDDPDFLLTVQGAILKDQGITWSFMDLKLRPCPFCLNEDIVVVPLAGSESHVSQCAKCKAVGPVGATKDEAMSLWGYEPEQTQQKKKTA